MDGSPDPLVHQFRRHGASGAVDLARLQRREHGLGVLDHDQRQLVHQRLAQPVILVGDEVVIFIGLEIDELERPGADGNAGKGARILDRLPLLLLEDRHLRRRHQVEIRHRELAGEADAGGAHQLDLVDLWRLRNVVRPAVRRPVAVVLVGEDDVLGGELGAVMPLHARTDLGLPHAIVRRDRHHLGGEPRAPFRQVRGRLQQLVIEEIEHPVVPRLADVVDGDVAGRVPDSDPEVFRRLRAVHIGRAEEFLPRCAR